MEFCKIGLIPFGRLFASKRTLGAFFVVFAVLFCLDSFALTIHTKAELRHWEMVRDRSVPITWSWESDADMAELVFSNRLTQTMSTTVVARVGQAMRGDCPHPIGSEAAEGLVVATLIQTSNGVAVVSERAELAYVARPITVRSKALREWRRVETPCLAGFDARWWNVPGASGHDVIWSEPPGVHRVERVFANVGVVDEAMLKFGIWRFAVILR